MVRPAADVTAQDIERANIAARRALGLRSRSWMLAPGTPIPPQAQPAKLYRFVQGFSFQPRLLNPTIRVHSITFGIPGGALVTVPALQSMDNPAQHNPPALVDGSLLHRMRCVDMAGCSLEDRAQWFTRQCTWPTNVFIEVNGNGCPYSGASRPIDLTYLMVEGQNVCKLTYGFISSTPDLHTLAVAVEAIRILSHDNIVNNVKRRPTAEVIEEIKTSAANQSPDDDDVAIVSSKRTISLLDPYSGSTTCKIPVRTTSCKHLECFDLENHLSQQKCELPGDPAIVDGWRCPICGTDARPPVLFRDGYMMQIRHELERRNQTGVRAITIASDGGWKAVIQQSPGAETATSGTGKKRKIVEVVELD